MKKEQPTYLVYDIRDILSIRELADSSCRLFADNIAFLFHEGEETREVKFSEVGEDIRAFSAYLNSLGLEGKKIAVTGRNSYQWALTYLTVCAGTGIIVPLDKDLKEGEIDYLMTDSDSAAVIYSDEMAPKFEKKKDGVIYLPTSDFEKYLCEGRKLREAGDCSYENHKIDPFALGILIYTSGTTGVAKGVMLSQHNICSNITSVMRRTLVTPEDRVLSVLPLHHTYECMSGFLSMFFSGASIAYNASLRTLQADLALFRPTILIGVPVLLEKLYSMIIKKYSKMKGGTTVLAAQRAVASLMKDGAARRKLFKAVSDSFGGRLNRILCGAASLSPEAFEGYGKFGYKVYIGYGLTETSPVCIMHNDYYQNPDDIGFPLIGVSAKICDPNDDGVGELAVSGPNVMLGYYHNPEETAKVIRNGWFYTGDLAKMLPNGAYKIVGRTKSMIVSPNGKKIFPEEIEHYIDESKLVAESMVFGQTETDGSVTIVASIYPDEEEVASELAKRGENPDEEERENTVKKLLSELVAKVNEHFPQYKSVRKLIVRKTEFIKTTTKKIKRLEEENKDEK